MTFADKYAAFIWPAYAVSALGFAWMIFDTLVSARRWRREAEAMEHDDPDRTPAAKAEDGS